MWNVLVVDDDRIVHTILDAQLKQYGYNPLHVETGENFIDIIEKNEIKIDAIILDIDLGPGLSGPEYAFEARKICNIPIVFHSSHSEKEILEKTDIINSYGYVVKGTNAIVIDVAIKNAIKLHSEMKSSKIHEELYKSIFDISAGSITINEYENPKNIIDCNIKFLDIFEYKKEDVIGKSAQQLDLWADPNQRIIMNSILEADGFVDNFAFYFKKNSGEIDFGYLSVRSISICDKRFYVVGMTQNKSEICKKCNRRVTLLNSLNESSSNSICE